MNSRDAHGGGFLKEEKAPPFFLQSWEEQRKAVAQLLKDDLALWNAPPTAALWLPPSADDPLCAPRPGKSGVTAAAVHKKTHRPQGYETRY
jgi:hypothetical protein